MKDFWEVNRRNEIRGNVFGVIWGKSNQASISILYQNSPFEFSFYQSTLRHSCLCLIKLYVATFCIIVIIIIIYPLLSRRRFLHSFLTLPSSSPLRPLETFIWHSHHPPHPNHIESNTIQMIIKFFLEHYHHALLLRPHPLLCHHDHFHYHLGSNLCCHSQKSSLWSANHMIPNSQPCKSVSVPYANLIINTYIYVFTSNIISICGLKRPTQKCQMWLTCIQDFFRLWQVFTPWEPISQFNSDEAFLHQQFTFSIIFQFTWGSFFLAVQYGCNLSPFQMYRWDKKNQNKMPWNEKALMRHWTLHHS